MVKTSTSVLEVCSNAGTRSLACYCGCLWQWTWCWHPCQIITRYLSRLTFWQIFPNQLHFVFRPGKSKVVYPDITPCMPQVGCPTPLFSCLRVFHLRNWYTGCVRLLSPFRESSSVYLDRADRICQLCEVIQKYHQLYLTILSISLLSIPQIGKRFPQTV